MDPDGKWIESTVLHKNQYASIVTIHRTLIEKTGTGPPELKSETKSASWEPTLSATAFAIYSFRWGSGWNARTPFKVIAVWVMDRVAKEVNIRRTWKAHNSLTMIVPKNFGFRVFEKGCFLVTRSQVWTINVVLKNAGAKNILIYLLTFFILLIV